MGSERRREGREWERGRRLKIPRACTAERRRRRSPRPPVVIPPLCPPHFHYINQNGIAFWEILQSFSCNLPWKTMPMLDMIHSIRNIVHRVSSSNVLSVLVPAAAVVHCFRNAVRKESARPSFLLQPPRPRPRSLGTRSGDKPGSGQPWGI